MVSSTLKSFATIVLTLSSLALAQVPCEAANTGGQRMPSDQEIKRICEDPAISYWLRDALLSALGRDPVDAANDAGLLSVVLDKRADEILKAGGRSPPAGGMGAVAPM